MEMEIEMLLRKIILIRKLQVVVKKKKKRNFFKLHNINERVEPYLFSPIFVYVFDM